MKIDTVVMTHLDIYLLVQGKRKYIRTEKKPNMSAENLQIKSDEIPFLDIVVLIKRLTLIDLFDLSVEDLVANR